MTSRQLLSLACFILCLLCVSGLDPAWAQEAAEAAPKTRNAGMEFLINAGAAGWLIMALSVVALGVSIERGLSLRRDTVVPPDVLAQLEQLLDDEEYEEAMTVCEGNPGFLTNTIAAGLPKIGTGWENISNAMGEVADFEATKIQQSISYINLIVNVAPLLGLLGTVMGMIGAFQTIAQAGATPDPAEMANNIQTALITTELGLCVAIPFSCVYFYYRNKVQRMVLEVNSIVEELMERFKE